MDLLFVKNKEDLKNAESSLTIDLDLDSVKSYLLDVEGIVVGTIGEESVDEVMLAPDVLRLIKSAVVNIALAEYSNTGSMLITNSGFQVAKSDSRLPASDKKLLAFRKSRSEKGWLDLERAITLMDARKSVFPIWHASDLRRAYHSTLFKNSEEFAPFAGLRITAQVFRMIKHQIEFVQEDRLKPILGEELFGDLMEKSLQGEILDNSYKVLLRRCLRVLGPLAIADAIPYQLIELDGTGVYQASVMALGGSSDNVEQKNVAQQRVLQNAMGRLINEGEANLVQLKKWLNEKADAFADYKVRKVYPMQDFNDRDSDVYLM